MEILDIGCGKSKTKGAVGIDKSVDTEADIIHDLNDFPYPFNDNEFDMVICNDVLEHLDDLVTVMEEIHRISKPNAEVLIRVPHFSSSNAYTDITHKHFFSTRSFDYFTNEFPQCEHYTKARFKKIQVKITFGRLYRMIGVQFFANKWPLRYERLFAFIFQGGNIKFKLLVLK